MRQVGRGARIRARATCPRGCPQEEEKEEEGTSDARVCATTEKRRKVMNNRAISCGAGDSLTP